MSRRVSWTPRALKDAGALDEVPLARVRAALERLATTGHGDVVKLRGMDPPEYRLRVGDYRVRLRLRADVLEVLHVLPRGKSYR